MDERGGVTDQLVAWNEGDPEAVDRLMPLIYEELHQQARKYFAREPAGHTLQPTALLHEAYLRLAGETQVAWQNRAHFFGAVARLMRRILVDHARYRQAAKRGGGAPTLSLDAEPGAVAAPEVDLFALDEALARLAVLDARQARIVELRFFAGLTIAETAEVTDLGTATVIREWRTAKAWLLREICQGTPA